ncbi:MAG TPA: hypothetical protein VE196_09945 [Pseudonocardiaceae bacterium]|nr:hypothetical protein [Pseudonocardiaceae bacterium]
MFASLAQFANETAAASARRDGLAAARARGRVGGRLPLMTPDKLATGRMPHPDASPRTVPPRWWVGMGERMVGW